MESTSKYTDALRAVRVGLALVLALGAGFFFVVGVGGAAQAAPDPKVVVCKYVGTPGGTLHHIVIVSENSLNNTPYTAPPNGDSWTDAHGQSTVGSIAIRYAAAGEQAKDVALSECPGETTTFDECPELPGDQPDGFACTMAPEVDVETEEDLTCTAFSSRDITTTTPYEFVGGAWVLGDPVTVVGDWEVRAPTSEEVASLGAECIAGSETIVPKPDKDKTPKADDEPTVLGTEAAVPTAVAAGAASGDSGGSATLGLVAGALLALSLLGGWVSRTRKGGAHQI